MDSGQDLHDRNMPRLVRVALICLMRILQHASNSWYRPNPNLVTGVLSYQIPGEIALHLSADLVESAEKQDVRLFTRCLGAICTKTAKRELNLSAALVCDADLQLISRKDVYDKETDRGQGLEKFTRLIDCVIA